MSNKKRQEQLKGFMETDFMIECGLDFSDCYDTFEVLDAACKLLVDNFDVAIEGSYIKEIIQQACYESAQRGVVE